MKWLTVILVVVALNRSTDVDQKLITATQSFVNNNNKTIQVIIDTALFPNLTPASVACRTSKRH